MTIRQRIFVCLAIAVFVLVLLLVWGSLAYLKVTPVEPLVAQLGILITLAFSLLCAFAGRQSAPSIGVPVIVPSASGQTNADPVVPMATAPLVVSGGVVAVNPVHQTPAPAPSSPAASLQ